MRRILSAACLASNYVSPSDFSGLTLSKNFKYIILIIKGRQAFDPHNLFATEIFADIKL